MMRKGTYVHGITEEQTNLLREAAAVLGYQIKRGVGAGEEGSLGQLMVALAERYKAQPDQVLLHLGIIVGRPWSLPNKYRLHIPVEDEDMDREMERQANGSRATPALSGTRPMRWAARPGQSGHLSISPELLEPLGDPERLFVQRVKAGSTLVLLREGDARIEEGAHAYKVSRPDRALPRLGISSYAAADLGLREGRYLGWVREGAIWARPAEN
jgi:hypothetical protein